MKRLNQLLLVAGAVCALTLASNTVLAQDAPPAPPADKPAAAADNNNNQDRGNRRNFDPAQMQQRMMDRYKEVLEVNSDDEWTALQPLVLKVVEARRDAMAGGFGGMRGMFGNRNRNNGGDNAQGNNNTNRQRNNPFGGTPMPEQEALQKAIDAKASNADMKAALEKFNAARKAKQADLEKAQADLRAVLSVRQEAIASLNGLL
jgi:hypothetical protein